MTYGDIVSPGSWYAGCLNSGMETATGLTNSNDRKADILFKCEHCGVPLVVDGTAAGMTLQCQQCGKPANVPVSSTVNAATQSPLPSASVKLTELQGHLKENEAQRTEINGYINQLSIQLHRWQLRLQTLNERNKQLTDEMTGLDRAHRPQA
jgi:transcription elongation factor Elf1